jgi:hypothetical protein
MEQIKERIITHINFIEAASTEFKILNEELKEIINNLQKEDDLNVKLELFQKYKSLFLYSTILYKDLENGIFSFIESYTCAFVSGVSFSEEEKTLYDKYVKNNSFNFLVDKGKLISKNVDLLKNIKENTKVSKEDLDRFLLNIDNFYNAD